ncbi:MAG TPA: metalloregulator ArsR/SmtB family transcription factor [Candidatus Acidoferrum sp.]|nr:metalloregulator ArsR/SmtB family transcription factor [Candidatus Acidoferrum sp.]
MKPKLNMLSSRDVFAAVGDPTRRRVLDLLARGELPVRRIAAPFAMSRPAISQHLRILLDARLVHVRRDGREHYYRLHARPLRQVYDWVSHYEQFWKGKLKALGSFLDCEEKRERDEKQMTRDFQAKFVRLQGKGKKLTLKTNKSGGQD